MKGVLHIIDLHKQANENEKQYIWRLGCAYDAGLIDLSWDQIGDLVNAECREDESEYRTSSAYRKVYQYAKQMYDAGVFCDAQDKYLEETKQKIREMQKERQLLSDERTSLRAIQREVDRREELYNVVKRAIDDYQPVKFDYSPAPIIDSDADMIIHLTDVHCGVDIVSPLNVYNTEVLKQRLQNFLDEIYEDQELYQAQTAYVIIGGDLIHGLIHVNGRLDSKEGIVEQIEAVADIIGDFIDSLKGWFTHVKVHSVPGNHGRSTANKEHCTKKENFDLLVPYILKKQFRKEDNVEIVDNTLDTCIATFMVRGHSVYAVHGDKDSREKVVNNMTKLARKAGYPLPDLIYMAHRHANGLTTTDGVKVIETGCCDGMDNYAIDGRFVGRPEQTITIVTEKRMIRAFFDVQLDN